MVFPLLLLVALAAPQVGPEKGTLIVVGGGQLGPEILDRFISLSGGKDAPIVVIPTAGEDNAPMTAEASVLAKAGMTNVTALHTRDRAVADTEAFVAPLKQARGVWFVGGRQWRLADSYLGTRTEKELRAVLDRGGVIAGTSAGATIQGSYLVRGAVEGSETMMSPGHEQGFGYLRGVAIDQHLIKRHREKDLLRVIEKHPELLGIGLDESTAIVVQGDQFEVIGFSKVAIYDNPKTFYFLSAGDRFDLKQRRRLQ